MKISIITVTYNCKDLIIKTLESLEAQTYKNYEHIIIDGASKDGTLEILQAYCRKNSKAILHSERDSGVYDAMNKGIKKSTGDYVYFLNAGDLLASQYTLEKVVRYLELHDNEILYGNIIRYYKDRKEITRKQEVNRNFFLKRKTICHQALFVKRTLFDELGVFNTRYKILADRDWLIKAWRFNKKFNYQDIDICIYDTNGISANKANIERANKEFEDIIRQQFDKITYFFIKARHILGKTKRYIIKYY